MGFPIACPVCGQTRDVDESSLGTELPCESCGHVFRRDYPYAPPANLDVPQVQSPSDPSALATPGVIVFERGVSQGFQIVTNHIGPLALVGLVYCAVMFGLVLLQQIPLLGVLFALVIPFTIQPVLTAGITGVALKFHDGQEGKVDDLFVEFRALGDLAVLTLVQVGIWLAAVLVPGIVAAVGFVPMAIGFDRSSDFSPPIWQWVVGGLGVLLLLVIMLVVGMILFWAYLAFVDRRRGFGDAISVSYQLTRNNPLGTFGVAFVAGMVGGLGFLACGIGLIVSVPASYCIAAAAYRTAMPNMRSPIAPGV